MGTGASKNPDSSSHGSEDREDQAGGQLYVSLKMENYKLKETLDFKFLLKPKYSNAPCVVEEGPNRQLTGGALRGDRRSAVFKLIDEVLEYRVLIKADRVSPFDLAASWRTYQENFQPSTVRGIPDVSMNSVAEAGIENESSASLELDLEHYVVPAPATSANSGLVYAANMTETPRSLSRAGVFSRTNSSSGASHFQRDIGVSVDRPDLQGMEVIVPDATKLSSGSGLVESKSVGTFSSMQKQEGPRGLFVDRGVGSPRLVKSASASMFNVDSKHDSESKVGLPARGKTFTAAKLTRYLRWLGHDTKHFNVGKYRRLKHGVNQTADFFRGDNPEGIEARNEVAALAMEDMISWMQEGGQVGIFDATNSTSCRRNMLMRMAEGKCKVYEPVEEGSYIKMIDMVSGHGGQIQWLPAWPHSILPGLGAKSQSPWALVHVRLSLRIHASLMPISFSLRRSVLVIPFPIVSRFCILEGEGREVNTHLTPRPILLTRHGESRDNVRGRIGGDSVISDSGELYARKLANFVEKRLKNEKAASIWTSTLQRTILTASPIAGFPKVVSRKKDKLRYRYPRGESYLDVIQRLEPVIIELERQRAPVVVISHQAVLRALYAYFADRPLKEIPHIEMPLHTIIEIQMGVTGVQEKRYKLM
ncbi:6-phosphofructo-2-kinase/fructose-2 6-bisphosphatase [Phtheirospermum japonicum]|uniref:6-phosphofructo-2-kinase/fructose-2 6-bisphosphatase n=1 Tax=Phtheirospermum japonicum TaxID=374723 RepID=A0A830B6H0_9LAMI|nr:6-phosphofructo-2-kinase/fructose-2 6-bisphosphatase [Phtheirospermum japonicum]